MSTTAITSSNSIQMDYMKLMVTELQNQNPLDPMDNKEMASQLAQFSSLQQLETLNSRFADLLTASKLNYINSLLGKKVSYYEMDALSGLLEMKTSTVNEVFGDVDGQSFLVIDRYEIGMEAIADSLVGQEISYFAETSKGRVEIKSGIVNCARIGAFGERTLVIDGQEVAFYDVVADSLKGMEVSFYATNESTGEAGDKTGIIDEVYKGVDGKDVFVTRRYVALEDVVSVSN